MSKAIKVITSLIDEVGSEYGAYFDSGVFNDNNLCYGFIVNSDKGQPFTIFISDEDISELFKEHFGEEVLDEEIASRRKRRIIYTFNAESDSAIMGM